MTGETKLKEASLLRNKVDKKAKKYNLTNGLITYAEFLIGLLDFERI